ncbi:uncharacterized protein EDB93DRAFT_1055322, partial [Suillus bovinus]|uniref:uncharacterized protein n=1 Tax=Suillus bovinus TaxID=48563 RepID=UPI001B88019E
LYVSSPSLETNVAILREEFIFMNNWLREAGLMAEIDKSELIHFTWRRAPDRPPILLHSDEGQVTINPRDCIKWLGIYFDSKLSFHRNVRELAGKAENIAQGIQMLANTVRGLSQSLLRTVYSACVRSVMTYASPIWWTGMKTHANMLTRVQNK